MIKDLGPDRAEYNHADSQTVCYLLLSVLSHLMANILTCYHGDVELPQQCGFPVSFLDFKRAACI